MKVGVIVEGKSDKRLLDEILPKAVSCDYFIIQSSEKKDQCKILDAKAMKERIETCLAKGCKQIYILIDLNTQCSYQRQYDCFVELRQDYNVKIAAHRFAEVKIIVVEREIESWMASHWRVGTNVTKSDLNRLMQREFNVRKDLSEEEMVQRFLTKKLTLNRGNNRSFHYFLTNLERVCYAS